MLFVCEKRAALDVVHNRLKGAGLGSSTALFHDSQSDRGDFIRELSGLYTGWIETQPATTEKELQARRAGELGRIAEARNDIAQLVTTMSKTAKGADVPVHELLTETLAGNQPPLQLDDRVLRLLPDYRSWAASRDAVARAMAGIRRATGQATLAGQAAGMIAQSVWSTEDVVERVEAAAGAARVFAERLLAIAPHLVFDVPPSLAEAAMQIRLAGKIAPAARAGRLDVLAADGAALARLRKAAARLETLAREAESAGAQGRVLEPSAVAERGRAGACSGGTPGRRSFSIFSGEWRATRVTVLSRVSPAAGTAMPRVTTLLRDLIAAQNAQVEFDAEQTRFAETYRCDDPATLIAIADELAGDADRPEAARRFYERVLAAPDRMAPAVLALAALAPVVEKLLGETATIFDRLPATKLAVLPELLGRIGVQGSVLRSLQPVLAPLAAAPAAIWNVIARLDLDIDQISRTVVDHALRQSFDAAPQLDALSAAELEEARNRIALALKALSRLNAKLLESRMVSRFRDHVILTNTADRDLDREQRERKALLGRGSACWRTSSPRRAPTSRRANCSPATRRPCSPISSRCG